jgi:hypothetical protein
MQRSIVVDIQWQLEASGVPSSASSIPALALAIGVECVGPSDNVRKIFERLAEALRPSSANDGLQVAKEWLLSPGLSEQQWDVLSRLSLSPRRSHTEGVDWTAEFAALLDADRHRGPLISMSPIVGKALAELLGLQDGQTCACCFPSSASIAWAISSQRPVTFFAADTHVAILMSLLAFAAGRELTVDRRNPIDGSYMISGEISITPGAGGPTASIGEFDEIISVPPFGLRISGERRTESYEAWQVRALLPRARRRMVTLIGDGLLFRETAMDVQFRERLIENHAVTIVALPSGMFGRASGVATDLVQVIPSQRDDVFLIDARATAQSRPGRDQDELISKHLASVRSLLEPLNVPVARVPVAEIAASNYSLLPGRYVKTSALAAVEQAADATHRVLLSDLATVERNKAPMPVRGSGEKHALTCLEVAPADIVDGQVRTPRRQVAFDEIEAPRALKVAVRSGDLLVSIKGNVGSVGIVTEDADLSSSLGEPWIVSQSLAIIRLKEGGPISSPEVLGAILSAPWVREQFERMAGGTTVKSLPMSAVRDFQVPVPEADTQTIVGSRLRRMDFLRDEIAAREENIATMRRELWSELWNVPAKVLEGEYA